jgi:cellulose biosynthesis protein BcsQ
MKTLVIHSHKGGVGKTTVALLLAKHALLTGHRACVIDLDFLGSGMADLFRLEKRPAAYLETFFLAADPRTMDVEPLLGAYVDQDLGRRELPVLLNLSEPSRQDATAKAQEDMVSQIANERRYREVREGTEILLGKLAERGLDLAVIDCHPGLDFLSETLRPLASLNVYLTTPNRSDCFGLLKAANLKQEIDSPRSFLIVNRAEAPLIDAASFRVLLESDPLVGMEAGAMLSFRKVFGTDDAHFAVIPESNLFRSLFKVGTPGLLPAIRPDEPEFRFCAKVLDRL